LLQSQAAPEAPRTRAQIQARSFPLPSARLGVRALRGLLALCNPRNQGITDPRTPATDPTRLQAASPS